MTKTDPDHAPATIALAGFQREAVDAIVVVVKATAAAIAKSPENRSAIALEMGTCLLQSPTGSGKTLMVGRALQELRAQLDRPTVWFWFTPYDGLAAQTRDALRKACPQVRPRDLYADREAELSRDGDVFIHTWASVAVENASSRVLRRHNERAMSVDDMIAELRARDWYIGVVVDEAHLHFRESAERAARFYLDVLRPDFTVLATATPHERHLEAFERHAGMAEISRVVIDRQSVVDAGLNKHGVMLGYLHMEDRDLTLVDPEQAILMAGWGQHSAIKDELAKNGVAISPLMLVQVEDQATGGEDPVERVRQTLLDLRIAPEKIAVHTSGQPDPDFHTLAYDDEKEVLIFKVAVATGFDAPRAWTLVSLRPGRGVEFGLQIVGRIMRVHPLLRRLHGKNRLLDRGYVFLPDPAMQAGINEAALELRAVKKGIELVTDRLDVFLIAANDARPGADAGHVVRFPDLGGSSQPDLSGLGAARPSEAAAALPLVLQGAGRR
ncbi:MAG: DEAD/DEAH box helicase family protein, partial [Alphaproteobacteria bacterium]|nr:DEAD/DEAH box helicase family protein [Alphaproteobacteria bacterium]